MSDSVQRRPSLWPKLLFWLLLAFVLWQGALVYFTGKIGVPGLYVMQLKTNPPADIKRVNVAPRDPALGKAWRKTVEPAQSTVTKTERPPEPEKPAASPDPAPAPEPEPSPLPSKADLAGWIRAQAQRVRGRRR